MEYRPDKRWKYLLLVTATILINTLCVDTLAAIHKAQTANFEGSRTETQKSNSDSKRKRSLNNIDLPNGYRIEGIFNGDEKVEGKYHAVSGRRYYIRCDITVREPMNQMEHISLLNLSSQETLMADSCTIAKITEDEYSCSCYFYNLTFTREREERLSCCSDSRDLICERGYQFTVLVEDFVLTTNVPASPTQTITQGKLFTTKQDSVTHAVSLKADEDIRNESRLSQFTSKNFVAVIVIITVVVLLCILIIFVSVRKCRPRRPQENDTMEPAGPEEAEPLRTDSEVVEMTST